jgi:hypothetical protein
MASPIANAAAGQIAILQTIIGLSDDYDEMRHEILDGMGKLIDGSSIPDLPAADQKAAREMAKTLIKGWVMGAAKPS